MKLLLTNVVWDNTYKETRYFESVNVRNEWFGLPDSLDDRPNVNFNVRGDLLASCVINIGGSNLVRMNYNYLIVHDKTNSEYLFYFINSCDYLNGGQIQYNLELDVITTYLPTISALPSHMYSAHIDRFKKSTNQVIYFDTSYQSKIWLEDIPNLAKRLTKKIEIQWKYTGVEDIDEWLNNNIQAWVYVFISKGKYIRIDESTLGEVPHDLEQYRLRFDNGILYATNDYNIRSEYRTLVVPIYKSSNKIGVKNSYSYEDEINNDFSHTYYFDVSGLDAFKKLNNDDSYVYSYVISHIPPISSLKYLIDVNGYTINNDLIFNFNETQHIISSTFPNTYYTMFVPTAIIATENVINYFDVAPCFTGGVISLDPISSKPIYLNTLGYVTSFVKDLVRGYDYGSFLPEPKLSKMNAKEMQLTSSFGNNFTFDGLKLLNNDSSITFNLYEPITPGSNASLVRPVFTDEDDGVYQTVYNNEIIGLLTNYDSTLPFAVNKLADYLANNKNFFMQRELAIGTSFGQGMAQAMGNLPFRFGKWTSTMGGISATLGAYQGIRNMDLTVDNMRNAPSTYQDTASNILLDLSILTDFGYYVEVWDALDIDKKIYLDNINHFGYVLNIEDDMTKYFHTRKYFNYVRGDIHSISNNLSNVVKNKIKAIFNNGIRLFHRDNFEDPVTQNYELWLEE